MTSPGWYELSKNQFLHDFDVLDVLNKKTIAINSILASTTSWGICDKCIIMFDVDRNLASLYAKKKDADPSYNPPNSSNAKSILGEQECSKILLYAATFAGRDSFVEITSAQRDLMNLIKGLS